MKRYKLLKPLPGIPVDMPFLERTDKTMFARRWYVPAERCDGDDVTQLSSLIVENNPEWFEEVQEKKCTQDIIYQVHNIINGKLSFLCYASGEKEDIEAYLYANRQEGLHLRKIEASLIVTPEMAAEKREIIAIKKGLEEGIAKLEDKLRSSHTNGQNDSNT